MRNPNKCRMRIDALHTTDTELLTISTDIAIAAHKLCGRTPPPALDGYLHWAELCIELRPADMRSLAWLMFWERVEAIDDGPEEEEGVTALGAGNDGRQTTNAATEPKRTCPWGISHIVVDLTWHILHDRSTKRFHKLPPTLDRHFAVVRDQTRDVLDGLATLQAVRKGMDFPLPYVLRDEGEPFELWRRTRPVQRMSTPMPGEHVLTEDSIVAAEYPDEEDGYDGRDLDDLPPSDEDGFEWEDPEWAEHPLFGPCATAA